jgi:oxygen-dependent protoporphyrinogen oxidase
VGGACDQGILERRDQTIVADVLHELSSLLEIDGAPVLTRLYRWSRANAQHEVGHLSRMAEIDRRLSAYPGLFVTGSGFRGTGIPDCVADGRAVGAQAAAFVGKIV